ncbi:MAG TPA: hypothetical protein VII13_10375 [Vicinamibacteria bacterium]|jgi:anti-sigma factor RsiW
MSGHLADESLWDAVDGSLGDGDRRHLEACPACAARVAEAREGWALAEQADVPEPSPLYWDAFRRQVDARIRGEGSTRRRLGFLWPALMAGATAVVAAVTLINPSAPVRVETAVRVVPAWSPSDAALLERPAAAGEDVLECEDVAECLADLSDEETLALAEILEEDLRAPR